MLEPIPAGAQNITYHDNNLYNQHKTQDKMVINDPTLHLNYTVKQQTGSKTIKVNKISQKLNKTQ